LTGGDPTEGRLDLLARSLPAGFEIRLVVLEPGDDVCCESSTLLEGLVEVECGELDLHLRHNRRFRVRAGDVLWLSGLGVWRLSNPGRTPAALTGLTRVG
jgi:hypothetical protein